MGFKMSVPCLGLTRNPNESGKHKAHGLKICKEAGYERASASRTLDRALSDQNTYDGFRSGEELWEYLEDRANNYRMRVPGKDKAKNDVVRERGLRKDAIVGFAVIWKPPAEVIRAWDRETRDKFFDDCDAVAEELEPEMFQPSNILMTATHVDEVLHGGEEHQHKIGVPLTFDGRYNGSDMLNHMRRNFNANFAAKMRERGWDMDDLDLYDAERAKEDEEYRAERRARRRKYGKSVNDYAADAAADAAEAAVEARIAAEEAARDALQRELEATVRAEQISAKAAEVEEESAERERLAQEKVDAAQSFVETARDDAEQIRNAARVDAKAIVDDAQESIDEKQQQAERYRREGLYEKQRFKAASDALDAARDAYMDSIKLTVNGISPGYFLRRCFDELLARVTPKKSLNVDGYQNLGAASVEPTRDTSNGLLAKAITTVRKGITDLVGSLDTFGEQVAWIIQREQQGKPIQETSEEIREAEQKQKELYASLTPHSYSAAYGHEDRELSL